MALANTSNLACAMRLLNQRHVGAFNRRHGRTWTLWESRFKSCLVDSERHVLAAYRYVELNPTRRDDLGQRPATKPDTRMQPLSFAGVGEKRQQGGNTKSDAVKPRFIKSCRQRLTGESIQVVRQQWPRNFPKANAAGLNTATKVDDATAGMTELARKTLLRDTPEASDKPSAGNMMPKPKSGTCRCRKQ